MLFNLFVLLEVPLHCIGFIQSATVHDGGYTTSDANKSCAATTQKEFILMFAIRSGSRPAVLAKRL